MQTKDNISVTQHKLQSNIGVAMEDNAAQQGIPISMGSTMFKVRFFQDLRYKKNTCYKLSYILHLK